MAFAAIVLLMLPLLMSVIQAAQASDLIEQQTGFNPNEVKQDAQQLKEEYLKKNWGELIAKNRVIGPIHNFFTAISPVFRVLFGMPYSLSLILLVVVLLWIYVVTKVDSALHAAGFMSRPVQIVTAVATGILLAQIRIFQFIAVWVEGIIVSQELWWMRLILIVVVVVVAFIIHYMAQMTIRLIRAKHMQGRELEREETLDEMKDFVRGVAAGRKAVRK